MIVISGDLIKEWACVGRAQNVSFICWDDDVYNLLQKRDSTRSVPGTLHWTCGKKAASVSAVGKVGDRVRVIIHLPGEKPGDSQSTENIKVKGYVLHETEWKETPVQIMPVKEEIFSRFGGLIETDALADKAVFVIGLGSVGSHIANELAESGVTRFYIMDHDRLEVGNIARHVAGLSHVGRFKPNAMADIIHEVNPYADVQAWNEKVSYNNLEKVREIVRQVHIVICAADNRPPKLITNRLCVEENKPCVFPGAFRRAHGGQILFVRPNDSLCYQCFLMHLPEQAMNEEISSHEQAENLAYTDRPVPIEPGLSNDIEPISNMTVKLVIQELLKGKETTLRSLDDDLVAPLYLWLNRREPGTQYENLEPMEFNINGMHILRW